MPVDKTGSRPQFYSLSQWQFNATTGEWRAGPANNYVLNPHFQADRIITSTVTGWTAFRESGASAFVTNVNGGAEGSSFALQIGTSSAYAGGVRHLQTVRVHQDLRHAQRRGVGDHPGRQCLDPP